MDKDNLKNLEKLSVKDILKRIKVPKDGDTSKDHVVINPTIKDDKDKSNRNTTLAAKTISAKHGDRTKVAESVTPPRVSTMTDKKTAMRHVNRRYVPAHSVQRTLQGRALPTAGIQASSTRNENMDETYSVTSATHVTKGALNTLHVSKHGGRPYTIDVYKDKAISHYDGQSKTHKSFEHAILHVKKALNEMKTQDSKHFPEGPVDDEIQDPNKFGRSLASKSMATLKQDLSYALQKPDPDGTVHPDSPVKDSLLGAPYNKAKDLSVDDVDLINKEIGIKLDA